MLAGEIDLGASWRRLEGVLGASWARLGASWGVLDRDQRIQAVQERKKWNPVAPTKERAMGTQGSWDPLNDQFQRNLQHNPQ